MVLQFRLKCSLYTPVEYIFNSILRITCFVPKLYHEKGHFSFPQTQTKILTFFHILRFPNFEVSGSDRQINLVLLSDEYLRFRQDGFCWKIMKESTQTQN